MQPERHLHKARIRSPTPVRGQSCPCVRATKDPPLTGVPLGNNLFYYVNGSIYVLLRYIEMSHSTESVFIDAR